MEGYKKYLQELYKPDYETYHETLGKVQDEVKKYVETKLIKKGLTLTDEDLINPAGGGWEHVAYETTSKLDFKLTSINPTPRQRDRFLHVSIYRMPSGRYELTMYYN